MKLISFEFKILFSRLPVGMLTNKKPPTYAGNCSYSTKLMNNISRQEINIVIIQINTRIRDAISPQLI